MSGVLISVEATKSVSMIASNCDVSNTEAVMAACESINKRIVELQNTLNIFVDNAPRHAFITFATPDYRWGVIAWLRSLRLISDKPAFIFTTREIAIPEDIDGVYIVLIPVLYENEAVFKRHEARYMLSKLWIFAGLVLDRVFYADADCVFLKPVDELFERDGFLVCPDYVVNREENGFNAGVMVFSPSLDLRDQIFTQITATSSVDGEDQKILNIVLRDIVIYISENYNLLRHFQYFGKSSLRGDVRVLHFIVKKPWECPYRELPDAMLVDLDDVWTSFLSPEERLELIAEWRRSIFYLSERRRFDAQEFMLASEERTKKRLKKIRSLARLQLIVMAILAIAIVAKLFLRP
jgi:hypothetical protein